MPRPAAAPNSPAAPLHLALVGLSGTGKSTVGARLAEQLGWPLVDLDALIEQLAGCSIAAVFADGGEAHFRALERAALGAVLLRAQPMVLACGGGTWADEEARAQLVAQTTPVLLDGRLEVLQQRLERDVEPGVRARPMLRRGPPGAALRELAQARAAAHALCPRRVDTSERTPEQVADAVLAAMGPAMATAEDGDGPLDRRAAAEGAPAFTAEHGTVRYPVWVEASWREPLRQAMALVPRAQRVAVIGDDQVAALHGGAVLAALRAQGLEAQLHTFVAGEAHKSLEGAAQLHHALAAAGLRRSDVVLGMGGGASTDLAGFVASTHLRGVACVLLPTSTLAAVDAAIGGKNGVNAAGAKNQVGTICPPVAVVVGLDLLATQSARAHRAGLVEALKVAALMDAPLLAECVWAAGVAPAALEHDSEDGRRVVAVLRRAMALKAQICAADPGEANRRAWLNYGHTIGHALEVGSNYALMHGEAVGLGMLAEATFAAQQLDEALGDDVAQTLADALRAMNMPVAWRRAKVDLAALAQDKKRAGAHVLLPVVGPLGTTRLTRVAYSALASFAGRAIAPAPPRSP